MMIGFAYQLVLRIMAMALNAGFLLGRVIGFAMTALPILAMRAVRSWQRNRRPPPKTRDRRAQNYVVPSLPLRKQP